MDGRVPSVEADLAHLELGRMLTRSRLVHHRMDLCETSVLLEGPIFDLLRVPCQVASRFQLFDLGAQVRNDPMGPARVLDLWSFARAVGIRIAEQLFLRRVDILKLWLVFELRKGSLAGTG
jgi:hypothetical protein